MPMEVGVETIRVCIGIWLRHQTVSLYDAKMRER